MRDNPEASDASAPPESNRRKPTDVELICADLFYGFGNYHTPIAEQHALVGQLIRAARLEGRSSLGDCPGRDELRTLFHGLWTNARGAEAHDDAAWTRFADRLRDTGIDLTSPPQTGDGAAPR